MADQDDSKAFGERVLIFASVSRDATISARILGQAKLLATRCDSIDDLCANLAAGAGVLLLAEEALLPATMVKLEQELARQPPWSDLPTVILTGSGALSGASEHVQKVLGYWRNVTFLERPVRLSTFISVMQMALTARRRQYEVRDLLSDLVVAKEAAEAANQSKSSFLANMSHEIRTPLSAMLGFSELLKEDDLSREDKLQYVQIISRNGKVLVSLIDDILDLSKVEAGRLEVEWLPTSPAEMLVDVRTTLDAKAAERGIALNTGQSTAVPTQVLTDPTRLRQILFNIVGNALKFTSFGSVSVDMAYDHPPGATCGTLKFTVQDTGCGISNAAQEHLFQPFSQADNSTTRKYGGTGLGLVLSRTLARSLGGDVVLAKSTPEQGSTFVISVAAYPAAGVEVPTESNVLNAPLPSAEPLAPKQPLRGLNLLVADDAPDNQLLLKRILVDNGAAVELVGNGAEALHRAMETHFDLILMDVQMPVLDGLKATAALRSQGYRRPIIAVTAHAMREERDKAVKAGCDDHVPKPINYQRLIATVLEHCPKPPGPRISSDAGDAH